LRDFYKTCRVSTSFQDALGVKIYLPGRNIINRRYYSASH